MEVSRRSAIQLVGATALGLVATDVLLDGRAEAAPHPESVTPATTKTTAPKPAGLGTVSIPKLGLTKPVYSGTSQKVLNKGGFGHWVGSAKPGAVGHCVLFAHRTSAGGPMRRANILKAGDIVNANGTKYTVRKIEIIGNRQVSRALNYAGGAKRISLITCTKPNGTPTSTKWRLIVRASA